MSNIDIENVIVNTQNDDELQTLLTLETIDLCYHVELKEKKTFLSKINPCSKGVITKKKIIRNFNAKFEPSQITAIIGPSGSGKTTLLDILSSNIQDNIRGDILYNNKRISNIRKAVGLVYQKDLLFATQTVRQCISFYAKMKLPNYMSNKEKEERVDYIINRLGLEHCKNTIIGDETHRGISGGELRRVSIAIEIISNPSILLLDEPTTGLDSTSTYKIIELIKELTREYKCTTICTIHQPKQATLNLFDKVIIMGEGRVVYQGKPQNVKDYFNSIGIICLKGIDPVDHVLEKMDPSCTDDSLSIKELQAKFRQINDSANETLVIDDKEKINIHNDSYKISKFEQFELLFIRYWNDYLKNHLLLKTELLENVLVALFFGLLYFNVNERENSYKDRTAAIFLLMLAITVVPAFTACFLIPSQRNIIARERKSGLYTSLPYYLAITIYSFPFHALFSFISVAISYWMIGFNTSFYNFIIFYVTILLTLICVVGISLLLSSVSKDDAVSNVVVGMVLLILSAFSGFLVTLNHVPKFIKVFEYISPYKYSYRILMKNEFEGRDLKCSNVIYQCPNTCSNFIGSNCTYPCKYTDGLDYLKSMKMDGGELWIDFVIIIGFIILTRLALYFIVLIKK